MCCIAARTYVLAGRKFARSAECLFSTRRGAGHQMFADVERRARAAGCHLIQLTPIQLTMSSDRKDSKRFCESLCFTASRIGFKRYL